MKIINSKEEFEKMINHNNKVVVDFYADWCGPCKMLAPIIDQVANENQKILFCKINVDEIIDLAQKYEVNSIPTLILFEKGVLKDTHVGLIDKNSLIEFINK